MIRFFAALARPLALPAGTARRPLAIGGALWLVTSLASAAQAYVFAFHQGRAQPWWPTLAYTAAIFSIWALLSPLALRAADRIGSAKPGRATAFALWLLGYPLATATHIALFVILFWPIYGQDAATPLAMAKPVFLANIDTSLFAYLALTAAVVWRRHRRSATAAVPGVERPHAGDEALWVRGSGGALRVPLGDIDWIAAAGDYAELHSRGRAMLTDDTLAALSRRLPAAEFARIHRGAIVRIDRIREMRRLGRGDAMLVLTDGRQLRLSRRYRKNITAHLPR